MKKNGTELKIETGIPIPENRGTTTGVTAVMRRLQVGESVLLHGIKSANNAAQHALGAGNYTCRKVDGGYRVWRTK